MNEASFRLLFGIFWIVAFLVRIYFQKKAAGAEIRRKREGGRTLPYFFLFMFSYILLLGYVFTGWFDFAQVNLPVWIRLVFGAGSLVLYVWLFGWSHMVLGKNWSPGLVIFTSHQLVTSGPFRYVRHPMYTAFILSAIGWLFLSANWLLGGFYFLSAVAMIAERLRDEERMLVETFGDEYRAYKSKTPGIFPRFSRTK